MSVEQNKKTVEQFFESANRGDMDTSMGLISADIVWNEIGTSVFSIKGLRCRGYVSGHSNP